MSSRRLPADYTNGRYNRSLRTRGSRFARLALLLLVIPATRVNGATAYHLQLQSSPSHVVPLLSRFGAIEIHVYDGGVRVESMALDSFSRNGSSTITLMNPIARLYTEVTIEEFPALIARMVGVRKSDSDAVPKLLAPVSGKVNGLNARRYRLMYDATEWMDIWTTTDVPENPQLRKIIDAFVRHFSPATALPLARIPGNPVYVELNTEAHPKFPLLQMRSLRFDASGEQKALSVGKWYFKAPLIDAIFR